MAAYTVEIQAGNDEGTVWQAMEPAETVEESCDAEDVAHIAAGNQNVIDPDGGPWRIVVWSGDTTDSEPAHILDGQAWLDEQADIAEAADAQRTA